MIERDFKIYYPEIDNKDVKNDSHSEKFAYDNYEVGDYEFWKSGTCYKVVDERNDWCYSDHDGTYTYYKSFEKSAKAVKDTKLARIFHKNNIIEGNGQWLIIKI